MMKLTSYQLETLDTLRVFGEWARPMDVGGKDGTHHTHTLKSLAKKGLAERKGERFYVRAAYRYRITAEGRRALEENGR